MTFDLLLGDAKALQPSRMSPTLMFLVVQVLSSAGSPVILSLKQTGFFFHLTK